MSCTALNVGESEPDVYVSEIKQSDVENDVSFCVGKLLVFAWLMRFCLIDGHACAWTPTQAQTATRGSVGLDRPRGPVGSVDNDSDSYLPISTRPNPVASNSWRAGELESYLWGAVTGFQLMARKQWSVGRQQGWHQRRVWHFLPRRRGRWRGAARRARWALLLVQGGPNLAPNHYKNRTSPECSFNSYTLLIFYI